MNIAVKLAPSIHIDGVTHSLLLSKQHTINTFSNISAMDIALKYKPDLLIISANDLTERDTDVYLKYKINVGVVGETSRPFPSVQIKQACHPNFVIAAQQIYQKQLKLASRFSVININPNILTQKAVTLFDEIYEYAKLLFFGQANIEKPYFFGVPGPYIHEIITNAKSIIDCGDGFGINAALYKKPIYIVDIDHAVFRKISSIDDVKSINNTDELTYAEECYNYAINRTYTKYTNQLLSYFESDINDALELTGEK